MLAGGDVEPSPLNYTGVTRSHDQGRTWSPLERFDVGFPREGKTIGQGPTGTDDPVKAAPRCSFPRMLGYWGERLAVLVI